MKRAIVFAGLVLASAGHARARTAAPHDASRSGSSSSAPSSASGSTRAPSTARGSAHVPATASAASHGPPSPHAVALPPLPPPHAAHAAAPLPMLPSIARVRVDAGRDRVVVTEDVSLPRGDWQSGGIDVFVAFGEPGAPIALDAWLLAAPAGTEGAEEGAERLTTEPAVRCDTASAVLVGRPRMAGVVVRVRESELRRAFASDDDARVRVRSLLRPPAVDGSGGRDVVVRLGVAAGEPMTLGRIEVASLEPGAPIQRASAALCGAEADPWPLALTVIGSPTPGDPNAIAPVAAIRHATDDLCVRWWAR